MLMLEIILLIAEIALGIFLINEYHYMIEYKRDFRYFEEYKEYSKETLYDIVEDVDNCEF